MQVCGCTNEPGVQGRGACADVQVCRAEDDVQMCRGADVQMCRCDELMS